MRLGTTTFSFTNEWLTRRLHNAELLERAAAFELGPGLEVVGHQLWRGYPNLDRDEILAFRRLCDRLGFEPAAIGGYVDLLRRPGRRALRSTRLAASSSPQIATAAARVPGHPPPRRRPGPGARAGRAVRRARRRRPRDRGPGRPDAGRPGGGGVLECASASGSPYVALVLDFSVSMTRRSRRRSSTPSAVPACVATTSSAIVALWVAVRLVGRALRRDLGDGCRATAAQDEARAGFFRFGRQAPRAWLPLVPSSPTHTPSSGSSTPTGRRADRRQRAHLSTCSAAAASRASSRASGAAAHGSTSTTWTHSRSSAPPRAARPSDPSPGGVAHVMSPTNRPRTGQGGIPR